MSSFHATFSVVDHFSGTPFSVLTPLAAGPRHAGQFSADTVVMAANPTATESPIRFDTTPPRNVNRKSGTAG
jgi:hypothetical protein